MNKKIFCTLFSVLLCANALASCNNASLKTEEEKDTLAIEYNSETPTIKQTLISMDDAVSFADKANDTYKFEEFVKNINNPSVNVASYKGTEDIVISFDKHIDKTISVDTATMVELNSSANTVILDNAPKGFTANAKADNIIINGNDITAQIKSDTGTICILGKNTRVHIYSGKIDSIIARNIYTKIYNHTKDSVVVTLTNGTGVTIPANSTYTVIDNSIQKGIIDKAE